MRVLSKVSTVLAVGVLAACSNSSRELSLAPGADGTYIAVGAKVSGTITSGTSTFSFTHARDLSVGVATAGPEPIAESESKQFMPASITKLVTTSLALQELGPDFHFATQVAWAPGSSSDIARDLVIVADGDPQVVGKNFGDGVGQQRVFDSIADQLRARGISRLEGSLRLISADERHDSAMAADGLEVSDLTTCFGAVSQSFNFNWNCGTLKVSSVNAKTAWFDPNLQFPFHSQTTLGNGALMVKPIFDESGVVSQFNVTGQVGAKGSSLGLPISDVKPWYGQALLANLANAGIETSQVVLEMPTGARASDILAAVPKASARADARSFTVISEPLASIIQYTNKPSDNFLADDIFKTIASHHGHRGDLRSEGQAAVREALENWFADAGRPDLVGDVQLFDGAGLSHQNRVTARAYLELLKQFAQKPWFPALWESLPIAGTDGTLKARMLGSEAVGRVRAKTGTLRGSYQLAGYVPRYDAEGSISEYVPFVILSEVDPSQRFDVFNLQTDIASKLLRLVNTK